jgi:predicted Zn-dependent protease
MLLRYAASIGSGPDDPLLLADLANMEVALNHRDEALSHAQTAQSLHRGSRRVAQVLGRILAMQSGAEGSARALQAKASGRGI